MSDAEFLADYFTIGIGSHHREAFIRDWNDVSAYKYLAEGIIFFWLKI